MKQHQKSRSLFGPTKYSLVAMLLHWLIALAIFTMAATGFWMTEAINAPESQKAAFEVYQLHKASGLTVLVLVVLRLLWRLGKGAPAYPDGLSPTALRMAGLGHVALYGLMLAVPLLGWAMVSASIWGLPTSWFDLFIWPHMPFLSDLPQAEKGPVEEQLKSLHRIFAYSLVGLALGHALMAIKHQFLDGTAILARMLPGRPHRSEDQGED